MTGRPEWAVLIGGWATHLRVGGEISYDIDFIVTAESRHRIQQVLPEATDNFHQGRKFSGEFEGIHLDIYVPHESQLGMRLRLRVEVLAKYVDREFAPPWLLRTIEAHAVTTLDEMFRLIRELGKPGKPDQKLLAQWRRAWVQEAIPYGVRTEAPARRL